MKIMFLADSLSEGGAERVTALLASGLSEKHNVSVYCLKKKEPEYPVGNRVRKFYCENDNSGVKARLCDFLYIKKAIVCEKPDVIVSLAGYIGNFLLASANIGSKSPLILSERSDPSHYPIRWRGRLLRNLSYYLCDGVVFQTKWAKMYFDRIIQNKSVVIMNPVRSFYAQRGECIEHKIVNCSRLSKEKNLPLLINAFAEISKDYPYYELHIYGKGEEQDKLLEIAQEKKIKNKVFFHGFVDNIYEEIKNAAMYISTSNYEGLSNSMLEALAIGIPTICTDCPAGGARMVIRDGKNGLLVPIDDKSNLVEAIRRYIENPRLAEENGRKGKKIVDYLSEERIINKWERYIIAMTKINDRKMNRGWR